MDRIHLKLDSVGQRSMLLTGKHPDYEGLWVAHEVHGQDVLFERIKEDSPSALHSWLSAIRAISLTATLMPALAVILWLLVMEMSVDWITAVTAIVGVLFLQISVNLFNDVGDYLKLIDLPSSLGGSGVIQKGWLTTRQVRHGAWLSLIIGCSLGIPALIKQPEGILTCGILAVLGVIGYSGKPFNLKYRALGDFAVFALCGPILTMGVSYAAVGSIVPGVLLIGCFFGFAAAAILNANNMNDIEVDTGRGASTLASVMGFKLARNWQAAYYAAAYVAVILLVLDSYLWLLLPLLTFPLVLKQISILKRTANSSDESLAEIRFDAAKLHLLLGILVCCSLVIIILTH